MTEDSENPLPDQRRHLKAPTTRSRKSGDFEVYSSEIVLLITQDFIGNDDDTGDNVKGNAEGEGIPDNNNPLAELVS